MSVYVKVPLTKSQIVQALGDITVRADYFNADEWCEGDAELLENAAAMIRREQREKKKP